MIPEIEELVPSVCEGGSGLGEIALLVENFSQGPGSLGGPRTVTDLEGFDSIAC